MASRTRLLLILGITLILAGGAVAYSLSRFVDWHHDGWTGVFYAPAFPAQKQKQGQVTVRNQQQPGEVIVTQARSPADGRFEPRDQVVSVSGIPLADTARLRALQKRVKSGDEVVFRVKRGGKMVDVPIRLGSPFRSPYVVAKIIIAFIVGATFLIVGLVILLRRHTDDPRALVFYAFALVSAMAIIGSAGTVYEQAGGKGIVSNFGISAIASLLVLVFSFAYAPLILHLSLIFPRERPAVARNPHLLGWIYAGAILAALMCVTIVVLFMQLFSNPAALEAAGNRIGRQLGSAALFLAVGGLLLALQVIWAGRREGVVRAFAIRPFRSAFALFGTFFAITMVVGRYGAKPVAIIAGILAVVLPFLIIATYPIFACVALVRSYRAAGAEEKRQVQWPLWGLLIALTTKIAAFAGQAGIGFWVNVTHGPLLNWRTAMQVLDILPTIMAIVIPLSFAAAILKYRLMNIDLIIRKTVVYAILTGAIVFVYLVLVGGLGTILVRFAGVQNQAMVIASTLVVAVLFVPLRNKLQTLVDRNLFRHKYDYPAALKAISADTLTATDIGSFLTSAAEKVQQALQNRAVVIFVDRHDELVAAAKVGVADALLGALRLPRGQMIPYLDRPFDPQRRELPDALAAALRRIEARLVVPINTPGTPANGFVALAEKLSRDPFDVEDIDFVRAVADQLDLGIDRIRAQREEVDFAQARAIQQTLLPREMPSVAGLDASGVWQPARMMGGDYYDLIKLSDTELAVCIGDVAGKGMPAALLMSGLQAAVRASASNSPRDLCERVRRVVVSSLSGGRFVTFFYATIDTAAMQLRWCNAGHNAPVLARADGSIVRLADGGPAFSRLFREAEYEEREIDLSPGDRILLFTDGASEATDAQGELLGEVRLEELVAQNRTLGAEALQQRIVDAALSYAGGELEDDLTLVVVAVT